MAPHFLPALLLAAPNAHAVTITIDDAADTVTLAGTLDWSVVAEARGPLQDRIGYKIVLPLSGSPFADDFTPPAGDTGIALAGTSTITVANSKVGFGIQSVSGLAGAYGSSAIPPNGPLSARILVFANMVGLFPAGSLHDDITYRFGLGLDKDVGTVTDVIAGLRVRTLVSSPSVGTDCYTTETYFGIDEVTATFHSGSPGTGGGHLAPVPVPGGGLLLVSGILGLGALRRGAGV